MLVQIGQQLGVLVAEHHIEGGELARIDIGSSDGGTGYDLRMAGRGILDDGGINVVPATDDQVLGSAGDADEAISRNGAEVTRDEPSVFGEGSGRVTDIAREDVWAAYHQHPALAWWDEFSDGTVT